ncbi:MAG: class I tRNA ligase family protein, partial [Asgard group archaeon]|nr:class I tRNA ligase family protein [Asgard group archaeon]
PKAKQAFEYTIDWLDDKACARKSGLGTPLPWDPEWIVETLSDSTIYMAYYTIARIINNHELSAEQLPNELFDYLFRDAATLKKAVKKSGLEKKLVKEMKEEFEYFYPPDFRASAKELVYNHLTFYIFQHLAIFPANHYPLEIEANGMIMIEGDKMSKSAGNSVTLKELMDKFGVDPTRFALAYCGEGIADASFRYADAEAVKKRLKSIYHELTTTKFAKEEQKIDKWIISRLQQKIRETKDHYANLRTRSAISTGFFDILNDLKWYETRSKYRKGPGYKKALVTLVDLMTPIIPHFAEEINDVLNRGESYAVLRSFPRPLKTKENQRIEQQETYVKNVKDDISGILNAIKKQETKDIKSIQIFITPRWKYQILQLYKQKPKNLIKEAMQKESIRKHGNEAVKYAKKLLKNPGITSFDLTPRSESSAIKDAIDYLKQEFSVEEIKVISALKSNHQKAKIAEPGRPGIALNFE